MRKIFRAMLWPAGVAAAIAIGMVTSCGEVEKDDLVDALPPIQTAPASIAQSAGGGAAASANFKVELRIGAPQPMGRTSSESFQATMGPAGR